MKDLFRDVITVIRHLPTLVTTFKSNDDPKWVNLFVDQAAGTKLSLKQKFNMTWRFVIPTFSLTDHKKLYCVEGNIKDKSDTVVIYINGILTSELKFRKDLKVLSASINKTVHGLYNPTNSIWIDLLESILGRTFNLREPITKSFEKTIVNHLEANKKVVLVAHSQGGIIVSNILKLIEQRDPNLLDHVKVITFGSAADEISNKVQGRHFVNEGDFVAQIGMNSESRGSNHTVIKVKRNGHSFRQAYLTGLIMGLFKIDDFI